MIIATLVPHNYMMPFEAAKCWMRISGFKLTSFFVEGPLIDMNRNQIIKYAIENDEDVLMIDSDVVFSPNDVMKMSQHLREEKGIVTGVCPTFVDNKPVAAIYKKQGDEYAFAEVKEGINEVDACGAAFLGISREVLKQLPSEPFLCERGEKSYGEDISFCRKAERLGVKIWCDSSIRVAQVRIGKVDI